MSVRRSFAMIAALAACGDSPGEAQSSTADDDGSETSSSSTSSEGSSSSTTGDPGDPEYPRPDPVEPTGTCPPESFGPITFDGAAWVCIPECGEDSTCPMAATGTAEPACATNPFSSAAPCETSTDCTVDGEMCGNIGGGQKGCLLPPSHCILRCDADECPQDMVCTLAGVCAYPP